VSDLYKVSGVVHPPPQKLVGKKFFLYASYPCTPVLTVTGILITYSTALSSCQLV